MCCKQTFFIHLLYEHTFHGFFWILGGKSLSLPAALYTLCSLSREADQNGEGSRTLLLLVGFSSWGALFWVEREETSEVGYLSSFSGCSWVQSLTDGRSSSFGPLYTLSPNPNTFHVLGVFRF